MAGSKRKVLIVEDEFILYQELVEFFEEKGYEIIGHEDGHAVDSYEDAVTLLEHTAPDIAVLDIRIRGKRDGLDLAEYIKEHYFTLIIMLTAEGNFENLERAKRINPDGFVLKLEKPIDFRQLWATISLRLPEIDKRNLTKSIGTLFKVKETEPSPHKHGTDPLDLETFIKWQDIVFIESSNSKTGSGNNNVKINTTDNKAYLSRGTLSEILEGLPDSFVRFDQSTIVNANHITAKGGRGSSLFMIGEKPFKLSERYKEDGLRKIRHIMGNRF